MLSILWATARHIAYNQHDVHFFSVSIVLVSLLTHHIIFGIRCIRKQTKTQRFFWYLSTHCLRYQIYANDMTLKYIRSSYKFDSNERVRRRHYLHFIGWRFGYCSRQPYLISTGKLFVVCLGWCSLSAMHDSISMAQIHETPSRKNGYSKLSITCNGPSNS